MKRPKVTEKGAQTEAINSVWQRNRVAAAVHHETMIRDNTQKYRTPWLIKRTRDSSTCLEVILTKLIDNEKLATVTNGNATWLELQKLNSGEEFI